MNIVAYYSFKGGENYIKQHYLHLLHEIEQIIVSVDAEEHKTKSSLEKTMPGQILYSPVSLNRAFSDGFEQFDWRKQRIRCEYPTNFYVPGYEPRVVKSAYREMDFIKEQLGVEVQFGKYAFMVYNVCAKMTIFNKMGYISAGVEIVPVQQFASGMSTGVSYFEQFIWDLEHRGVADIDIPVLILGINTDTIGDI